jgi:hypothetical protein
LIGRAHPCGGRLETRGKQPIWNAGQNRPGELRVYAQSLSSEVSPSNGSQLNNALLALRKNSRVLRHRRAFADCLGANPVASALGNRTRRDPGTAVQPYHEGFKQTFESGTFYLAGNRNFLFGSDIAPRRVFAAETHVRKCSPGAMPEFSAIEDAHAKCSKKLKVESSVDQKVRVTYILRKRCSPWPCIEPRPLPRKGSELSCCLVLL